MFFSVMAKMFVTNNKDCIMKMKSKADQLISNVLIDYQNRGGMRIMKEQSIMNDYVQKN